MDKLQKITKELLAGKEVNGGIPFEVDHKNQLVKIPFTSIDIKIKNSVHTTLEFSYKEKVISNLENISITAFDSFEKNERCLKIHGVKGSIHFDIESS